MRILVIDDYQVVYQGILHMCEKHMGNTQVSWASNLKKAQRILQEQKVDLIISELDLIEVDTAEVIESFCERFRINVLVYTSNRNAFRMKWMATCNHIRGFVFKEDNIECLYEAVSNNTFKNINDSVAKATTDLSKREEEVLNFIQRGYNNRSIADRLQISVNTVATYKHRLFKKLGLSSDYELFTFLPKGQVRLAS